jgi:hypothetical protein
MSAVAEETMLSAELWLSFSSLVRAYAAAASVNAGPAAEVEVAVETLRVTVGAACLEMRCSPETGAGNWTISRGEAVLTQGRLELLPEGRIALDGKTLDLDHAAIDLVASVVNAATNPSRDER